MNPFAFAVLASACVFGAQRARAADLPVPYNHVEYKQIGNTYSWTPLNGPTPGGGGVVFRGDTTISTAEPKISTMQRLPFDKRGDVPPSQMAKVTSPFTKANFGKALTAAAKIAWPIGVAMQAGDIYDYLKSLGLENVRNAGDGIAASKPSDSSIRSDGYEYAVSGRPSYYPSPGQACQAFLQNLGSAGDYYQYAPVGLETLPDNRYLCVYSMVQKSDGTVISPRIVNNIERRAGSCPAGSYIGPSGCSQVPDLQEVDQAGIEDMIAQQSGWPTAAARALQSALQVPGVTIETKMPTVTGPSSVPGTKETTTTGTNLEPGTTNQVPAGTPGAQPGTVTTTTTTTNNATYNNNQVTNNYKTTVTTTVTNNVTNQTTTINESETEKEQQEDETPNDTPLGGIPNLYERKYPDGIKGIWNEKSAELKQLPLFTLAERLMPTGISGGVCPTWHVDLSFGHGFGEYGLQDVSPPCWIWDIAKVIIIASALILARALVFGG